MEKATFRDNIVKNDSFPNVYSFEPPHLFKKNIFNFFF